ncbi:TIGR02221 family CRISPR-associated protein [Blastochloris sulfoviridis]|uniref:TIGR02221 family CRISPR-associated protein n=1 Tax=Blastochloris sulfoviridis TaxID=50712 RepID=A0A5M6HQQ7_9HYPH|nr:TIGR02221 family CRISPR-associated protein [Blastochloris sulfoviridis]KAA5598205.1 TIGR02221 family CRISPR-associated protein [Blastochloris sulfoviridis]
MARLLITFLGAARRGYDRMAYDFGGGEVRTASYFASALLDHLLSMPGRRPTRLVVLGTTGSMWDDVLDSLARPAADDEAGTNLFLALQQAGLEDRVDAKLLAALEPRLSAAVGIDVDLRLVSYAETADQASDMVRLLASIVGRRDAVEFDITHGLRHLAMLALFAAQVVEAIKDASVEGIWYGAREMSRGRAAAPVIRLDGLLAISRWVRALAAFDAAGDLRHLAPLLTPDDTAAARRLEHAAFRERILRLGGTEDQFRGALRAVARQDDPIVALFAPELQRRLVWASEGTLSGRQHALARIHLEAGDYVRAAVLGFEATVTREMELEGAFSEEDLRNEDARSDFQRRIVNDSKEWRRSAKRRGDTDTLAWITAFHDLKEVRNAFAHAAPAEEPRVMNALEEESRIRRFLADAFDILLAD